MQEWTTIFDVVFNNETTLMNNYQDAVIIGSCGAFFIMAIIFCIIFKLYNHRTKINLEDNDIQHSVYVENFSMNVNTKSTNYKSLELTGTFDPEIYENTCIDHLA